MSEEPKDTTVVVPDDDVVIGEIPEERALAKVVPPDIATMTWTDPERASKAVTARIDALVTIERAAIKATSPSGWLVMKGETGEQMAIPVKGACAKISEFYGIQVFNLRPRDATGRPAPIVTTNEPGDEGEPWMQVEIVGDVMVGLTRRLIEGVRGVRRSNERFVGRTTGIKSGDRQVIQPQPQDLQESAMTSLLNKAARIGSGIVSKPPAEVAAIMGIAVDEFMRRCRRGSGFGTSDQRREEYQRGQQGQQAAPAGSQQVSQARSDQPPHPAEATIQGPQAHAPGREPGEDAVFADEPRCSDQQLKAIYAANFSVCTTRGIPEDAPKADRFAPLQEHLSHLGIRTAKHLSVADGAAVFAAMAQEGAYRGKFPQ